MKAKYEKLIAKLGTTPNEEPEIGKIYSESEPIEATERLLDLLSAKWGDDLGELDAMEAAEIISAVKEHVLGYRDSDGNFKRIECARGVKPLRMKEAMEVVRFIRADDMDSVLEIVGKYVPEECKDEWSRGLVQAMLIHGATDVARTAMGFELGN